MYLQNYGCYDQTSTTFCSFKDCLFFFWKLNSKSKVDRETRNLSSKCAVLLKITMLTFDGKTKIQFSDLWTRSCASRCKRVGFHLNANPHCVWADYRAKHVAMNCFARGLLFAWEATSISQISFRGLLTFQLFINVF